MIDLSLPDLDEEIFGINPNINIKNRKCIIKSGDMKGEDGKDCRRN